MSAILPLDMRALLHSLTAVWAASIQTISGYRVLAGEGEGSQLGEE
jgi:hypothetical protein